MTTAVAQLGALAQSTRLAIFRLLVTKGANGITVGEIGSQLNVASATLSFHLKELHHAGLISARQESRFIFYSANYDVMNELLAFLTDNCCANTPCELTTTSCCPAPDLDKTG